MKVLIVVSSLEGGGTERFAVSLAEGLLGLNVEVVLVTFVSASRDVYKLDPRATRYSLNGDRRRSHRVSSRLRIIARTCLRLRQCVKSEDPDVVLALGTKTNIFALVTTLGLGVPVVVSERADPRKYVQSLFARALRKTFYRCATRVVVQTASVATVAEQWVSYERIVVLPNPAPSGTHYVPLTPAPFPHVVAMGRLSKEKGFDSLIRAFEIVHRKWPDCRLTILGEGPERGPLEDLLNSLSLHQNVTLPGFHVRPTDLLVTGWVFVLPSRFEGFPNALLEALALGLPCIATDCLSGPREILGDGTGLLVPVDDPFRLAEMLMLLLDDDHARKQLSVLSRARSEVFRHESVIQKWYEMLRSVSEVHRSRVIYPRKW